MFLRNYFFDNLSNMEIVVFHCNHIFIYLCRFHTFSNSRNGTKILLLLTFILIIMIDVFYNIIQNQNNLLFSTLLPTKIYIIIINSMGLAILAIIIGGYVHFCYFCFHNPKIIIEKIKFHND